MSRKNELEQMVMRECEFLSYYLEDYEKKLSTDLNNEELKLIVSELKGKWEAYDKVYRYIKTTLQA
jgi:hypothetical protein|tara:strand:- start:68 stop:265 length:198 start_codon:yes stop_codon:yes gene_type:complete